MRPTAVGFERGGCLESVAALSCAALHLVASQKRRRAAGEPYGYVPRPPRVKFINSAPIPRDSMDDKPYPYTVIYPRFISMRLCSGLWDDIIQSSWARRLYGQTSN